MLQCPCLGCKTLRRVGAVLLSLALLVATSYLGMWPGAAQAATLSAGSTTLSSNLTSDTSVSYTIDVSSVTLSSIKCIAATFSTAIGGSTLPTGMDISSAAYNAAGSDFVPDIETWTASTTGATVKVTNATGETPGSASGATLKLTGITNSSTANTTYYTTINTYTNVDCSTGSVDTNGISTFAVADAVSVSATVNPSLGFSVGATSCSLGTLSTAAPVGCTFTMTGATNSTNGYSISYPSSAGTLTTSGGDSITAIGNTAAASSAANEQFGINLKDNATPNVGAEASGGTGAASSNYDTADSFAWDGTTGRTVASVAGPSATTTYTVSTMANIAPTTEAGVYTLSLKLGIVSNY